MKLAHKCLQRTLLVALVVGLTGCTSVPITGRKQLRLMPVSTMMSMSSQQYSDFLEKNPPSNNAEGQAQVRRVGRRIQGAVEEYMTSIGHREDMTDYDWQFNLVDDDQINAWALPGGRVIVYSGLLEVAQNDTGLAVVMGHEIAHALADHGNERVSQMMLAQAGTLALAIGLSNSDAENPQLWMLAFGIGTQLGLMLPYSRLHESEADYLGLVFMSMAGYDPRESVAFWQRMSEAGEAKPPEIISTHPSDATRIRNLTERLPETIPLYEKALAEHEAERDD